MRGNRFQNVHVIRAGKPFVRRDNYISAPLGVFDRSVKVIEINVRNLVLHVLKNIRNRMLKRFKVRNRVIERHARLLKLR